LDPSLRSGQATAIIDEKIVAVQECSDIHRISLRSTVDALETE
jgi:hypothetical protein